MSLRTVPVSFKQAGQFVADWHRHHRPLDTSSQSASPTGTCSSGWRSSGGRSPGTSTTA